MTGADGTAVKISRMTGTGYSGMLTVSPVPHRTTLAPTTKEHTAPGNRI